MVLELEDLVLNPEFLALQISDDVSVRQRAANLFIDCLFKARMPRAK
jgi:hypothetical protein